VTSLNSQGYGLLSFKLSIYEGVIFQEKKVK
jgi:hypothetical protein